MEFPSVYQEIDNSMTECETRLQVFVDQDDLSSILHGTNTSFDFGTKKLNKEYRDHFNKGELCSYGVQVMKRCKCCNIWSEVDALWAIHATSPEEALKFYREYYAPSIDEVAQ